MNAANGYPVVVLAPVAGLAAYCISQIAIAHAAPGRSPYMSLSRGFLVGFAAVAVTTVAGVVVMRSGFVDGVGYGLLNLLTYLAEILDAGGELSAGRLRAAYNADSVSDLRLARLLRGGHLVERNGRLVIGRRRFMIVARIFDFLHWLIIGCGHSDKHD
jgi:hypothetical protein